MSISTRKKMTSDLPNENGSTLDEVDRDILNRIQSDFPLDPRPYEVLGRSLGLPADQVLTRVQRMRREGLIRRIGGNFSSISLGYASTLCAAKVPPEKIDNFIAKVNAHRGVTHNYLRKHGYNVWFTFIAPTMAEIEDKLAEIAHDTGVEEILNLPAEKTFKIKVDFRFD